MFLILDLMFMIIITTQFIHNEIERGTLWIVRCDGFGRREFDSFNHIKHTERERMEEEIDLSDEEEG